jgi:hypothetical protein
MSRTPSGAHELLLEAALGAFRRRDAGGHVQPSGAWWDLALAKRAELFEVQTQQRALERAADFAGLNTTTRAVLERARLTPQLDR